MATRAIRIVTGVLGGVGALLNVGVGSNVTHPTNGNPTWTTTGLWFDFNDNGASQGTAWFSKTGANTGTLIPWGLGGNEAYTKPDWATGPAILVGAGAQNGPFFGLLGTAERSAITSVLTDGAGQAELEYEGGLMMTFGVMFYVDTATYTPVANPTVTPENSAATSINRYTSYANGTTKHEIRAQSVNIGGFRPSMLLTLGDYDGTETLLKTPLSAIAGHLGVNLWYEFQGRIKRSSAYNQADGRVEIYFNGRLVAVQTNALIWPGTNSGSSVADPSLIEHFMSAMYGWVARTGITPCFCGPYKVEHVPDADLAGYLTERWEHNNARGLCIQRLWPCQFPNVGKELSITSPNGATIPTLGRVVNTGGVFPARTEFVFRGTAGKTWVTKSQPIWDSSQASRNPFGPVGWTYANFAMDTPNGGVSTFEVRNFADSASFATVVIDDSGTGAVTVNGQAWLAGRAQVPAETRWQVLIAMRPGAVVVILVNLTTNGFDATLCRTRAVASTYTAGASIGPAVLTKTNSAAAGPIAHGAIGVCRRLGVVFGDSYTGANATEYYAISAVNQGTQTYTFASMGARALVPGDKFYVEGSNGNANDGVYTVASATATTITTVEPIPSATATGNINTVYPRLHSLNRFGQPLNSGADCEAIPNGYDPCPFGMDKLAGFAAVLNLARSGGRASELLANVLPNCTDMPAPWVLMQCFAVNDTTATTTEAAMETQARSIANIHALIASWVEARGGEIIATQAPNLQDAGIVVNGVANRFRRRTPKLVGNHVEALFREIQTRSGSMFFARTVDRMDANAVTLADGIHVDSTPGLQLAYELHPALQAAKSAPGFNGDGSTKRSRKATGGGPVLSPIA